MNRYVECAKEKTEKYYKNISSMTEAQKKQYEEPLKKLRDEITVQLRAAVIDVYFSDSEFFWEVAEIQDQKTETDLVHQVSAMQMEQFAVSEELINEAIEKGIVEDKLFSAWEDQMNKGREDLFRWLLSWSLIKDDTLSKMGKDGEIAIKYREQRKRGNN